MSQNPDLLSRYRGCLTGGAAGDALGYTVEFDTEADIDRVFGAGGITAFPRNGAPASDDTQMTAFTANAVLISAVSGGRDGFAARVRGDLAAAYRDWYRTQIGGRPTESAFCRIMSEPLLFVRRAPGNTCMSAIAEGAKGTVENPVNRSKGCGGVMRAAPCGLILDSHDVPGEAIARLGADAAAVTHGHPLGWLSAAAFACMIDRLAHFGDSIADALHSAAASTAAAFPPELYPDTRTLITLLDRAQTLAESTLSDRDAVHRLGEGWVGEEALAIAVCCALRYETDPAGGIIAAVNHRGDSDSTGAVAGNLLGARNGADAIPAAFRGADLCPLMESLAEDLASAWTSSDSRYLRAAPAAD